MGEPEPVAGDINAELQKCMSYNVDLSKVALYALGDATQEDLTNACKEIQKAYNENIMQNSSVPDFIFPSPATESQIDSNQEPLDLVRYHVLEFDKGWKASSGNNKGVLDWYPFGFAVVTSKKWREEGIVLVHCQDDEENEEGFSADSCVFPAKEVGMHMLSLVWGDEDFEGVKTAAQVGQAWQE